MRAGCPPLLAAEPFTALDAPCLHTSFSPHLVSTLVSAQVIAVIVATNAIDLLKGHDVYGYLNEYLRRGCMPNMTVMHGSFVPTVESMQILLFYGAKWPTVEVRPTHARHVHTRLWRQPIAQAPLVRLLA